MGFMDDNPYQSPVASEAASSTPEEPHRAIPWGVLSLLLASIPVAIVGALVIAYCAGLPSPTPFVRSCAFIAYGSAACSAVATGVVALFHRVGYIPMAGIVIGLLEIAVLVLVLFAWAIGL